MSTGHSIYNAYVIGIMCNWKKIEQHVENVIMMVKMQAMSLNFALAQKENTSLTVDVRVIFDINDI